MCKVKEPYPKINVYRFMFVVVMFCYCDMLKKDIEFNFSLIPSSKSGEKLLSARQTER